MAPGTCHLVAHLPCVPLHFRTQFSLTSLSKVTQFEQQVM